MKTIPKIFTLLICFHFFSIRVWAQTNDRAFFATWELDQSAYYGKNEPPVRYTKTFYPNHTFINEQTQASKTFTSHLGKFQVNNDETYTERASYVKEGINFVFKDKDVIIHYHFSEDKKLLTLNFTVANGASFTEYWRRTNEMYVVFTN